MELIEEREVHMKMKYTVTWKETSSLFEKRMEKYFGDSSMPYIWELFDNQDKTGWKFIHGDVFQYPYYKSLFAAAVGSGTQLFTLNGWCISSIQARISVYFTSGHLCSHISPCRLYISLFLCSA